MSSGDTGEVTVSPATLTFTNANWDTPQTVTVLLDYCRLRFWLATITIEFDIKPFVWEIG